MSTQPEPPRTLYAGAGRAVITPPVGIQMMGYVFQECVAESIERELMATALVLSDGRTKAALIACDVLFIQNPHADRMRERIGEKLGIPASHVLLNTSHTHLGPMMPGWRADNPQQTQMQQRYLDTLEESLVGVAAMADSRLQPARIGAAKGSAPLGINRRERLEDGRVVIGENPDGPVDNEVGIIRVDDLNGKSIAVVMKAAAHTVSLGPKTPMLSPDYVGPAREIVESATGAVALFLQGAAGNVNPSCGIGNGGPEQYDDRHRLGSMLAGEALKTWAQIRTHHGRGPRRILQSVAAVSVWDYEPAPEASIMHLDVAERRLSLALSPLPDRAAAERNLQDFQEQFDRARAAERIGDMHCAQRQLDWSQCVMDALDSGENPPKRELVFWAMRINDIGIVAVSGEPFAELGLEVKSRSPLAHTFFLGYSNGCLGYLPTPQAFEEGGMAVNESTRNYLLPSRLTPEWGPAIVETSLKLLTDLR
ncbi:MAG: neutral/alkaline non-lysosomal ceramidase N-terminal domain-containing protein [Planctomycetota bacterium]|nr:neutral/alkaline non-lysosomal ceramidase N-terminal domain-containing protein [Planctomycetota bacterium]